MTNKDSGSLKAVFDRFAPELKKKRRISTLELISSLVDAGKENPETQIFELYSQLKKDPNATSVMCHYVSPRTERQLPSPIDDDAIETSPDGSRFLSKNFIPFERPKEGSLMISWPVSDAQPISPRAPADDPLSLFRIEEMQEHQVVVLTASGELKVYRGVDYFSPVTV